MQAGQGQAACHPSSRYRCNILRCGESCSHHDEVVDDVVDEVVWVALGKAAGAGTVALQEVAPRIPLRL
jgi:hypothetical protein|eukprot:COSAG06_NODE_4731_length_3996_cov_2.723890_4_plen_69_part_00